MFYYTPGETTTFDLGGIWHMEANSTWIDSSTGDVGIPISSSHGNWRGFRMRPDFVGDSRVGDGPVASVRGALIGGQAFQPGRPDEFRTALLKSQDPLYALKQSYSCREYGFIDSEMGTQDKPGDDPCAVFWGGSGVGQNLGVSYEWDNVGGRVYNNRTRLVVTFNDNTTLSDVPIPNAYRTICLGRPIQSGLTASELFRCWTFVLNLRPRVAACSALLEAGDCGKKSAFPDGVGSVIPVAAGQMMKAYVYFEDYNRDLTANCSRCDHVEISVKSNPGLPNGATLFATKGMLDLNNDPGAPSRKIDVLVGGATGKAEYFVASRELHFTPSPLDARLVDPAHPSDGIKYQVCFEAKSRRNGGAGEYQYSDIACMFFQVVRPQPVLEAAEQARPTPGVVLDFDAQLSLSVRCPYAWDLHISDAKDGLDASELRVATDFDVGYEAGKYHIVATEDPARPLPEGAVITQGAMGEMQQLRWTPTRGMEGHEFELCLRLKDAMLDEGAVLKCTMAFVRKCEVCSLADDTLNSIAMEYHTDWLQLWGANYMVENPNHVPQYQRLKLGPLYTTSKDESVTVLASNFGMTEEGLRRVNPDLAGMDRYSMGTPVCLIPQICGGVSETAM